ncbi:MAG: hypothetical protein QN183_11505 [Armatimonadota bacterium]|nr:hypothetical protein [Armatimonadota bacterium]MDR7533230.1 hypothetical protein [Armatimonadota bacterium]MDR7536976.1 hypothetical protein [Armatimonadota bacterium]
MSSGRRAAASMVALAGVLVATGVFPATISAHHDHRWRPVGHRAVVRVVGRDEVFCTSRSLLAGSIAVPAHRCFRLALVRRQQRVFLAFLEPTVVVSAGHVVIVTRPVVRPRILFLVPFDEVDDLGDDVLPVLPVHGAVLVPVRVVDLGPRLTITVVDFPRLFVTFSVPL